jgi:hypothetical protein
LINNPNRNIKPNPIPHKKSINCLVKLFLNKVLIPVAEVTHSMLEIGSDLFDSEDFLKKMPLVEILNAWRGSRLIFFFFLQSGSSSGSMEL